MTAAELKSHTTNKKETKKALPKYANETITLNFNHKEPLKQIVKPSQRSQSNSFLTQSKSLNTLLPASKDFLAKPLAIQTIYEENEAVKQEPSESYTDQPQPAPGKRKPLINFEPLKLNKLRSFRDENASFTLEKQQLKGPKTLGENTGNQTQVLSKEVHTQRQSSRPFSKKHSTSTFAKEPAKQAATAQKAVRAPFSAKGSTKDSTVSGLKGAKLTTLVVDQKGSEAATAGRSSKKLGQESLPAKVNQTLNYSTHQGSLRQHLTQNLTTKHMQRHISNISISYKAKEAASKDHTPSKKLYQTIDQSKLRTEADDLEEPKGDSPLDDAPMSGQYKTIAATGERVHNKSLNKSPAKPTSKELNVESTQLELKETQLENKRGSKKSENTVTFDFHPEKAEQP